MKVVFLDIDGVLNDAFTTQALMDDTPKREHLDCLKEILDKTGAKVVLSSTWRLFSDSRNIVKNCLQNIGSDIYDITKELSKGRGAEIAEWISRHSEVESFVILDDDISDMKQFKNNIVKTTFYHGLLPEHIEKAIKILNS